MGKLAYGSLLKRRATEIGRCMMMLTLADLARSWRSWTVLAIPSSSSETPQRTPADDS